MLNKIVFPYFSTSTNETSEFSTSISETSEFSTSTSETSEFITKINILIILKYKHFNIIYCIVILPHKSI